MANRVFAVNACQEMGENFVSSPYVQIKHDSYHGTVVFRLSSEDVRLFVEDLMAASNKVDELNPPWGGPVV